VKPPSGDFAGRFAMGGAGVSCERLCARPPKKVVPWDVSSRAKQPWPPLWFRSNYERAAWCARAIGCAARPPKELRESRRDGSQGLCSAAKKNVAGRGPCSRSLPRSLDRRTSFCNFMERASLPPRSGATALLR